MGMREIDVTSADDLASLLSDNCCDLVRSHPLRKLGLARVMNEPRLKLIGSPDTGERQWSHVSNEVPEFLSVVCRPRTQMPQLRPPDPVILTFIRHNDHDRSRT